MRPIWWLLTAIFGFLVLASVAAAAGSALAGDIGRAGLMLVFGCVQTGFVVGSFTAARGADPLTMADDAAE
jgi:hypothetical protein